MSYCCKVTKVILGKLALKTKNNLNYDVHYFSDIFCYKIQNNIEKKVLVVVPTLWCMFVKTLNLSLAVKFTDFYS